MSEMTDTITVAINLPVKGSRMDYLRHVSAAFTAALQRGDRPTAYALAGLLTMCDEADSYATNTKAYFFNPAWGRTA